ncbi:MAG: hypothetical protein EOP53_07840 [Sphingobacteriales bacterium]|nr:MAG: hypothetical protein EOP53_07840 [Sphingobacteriales bacterium]
MKNNHFDDLRLVLRIFGILPLIWIGAELLEVAIGTMLIGHFPKYGSDPDPSSLNLSIFLLITGIGFFLNVCIFPIWLLILIHLLINKFLFTKRDYFLIFSMLFGLAYFFVLRIYHPKIMDWISD